MQKQRVVYPIIGVNLDDDDRSIQPGFFRALANCKPTNDGLSKAGGVKAMGGTLVKTNAGLASGTNTCIGAYADAQNNRIIYFLHNSSNNHSIWSYNPIADTHLKLLQNSNLAFSLSNKISSINVLEDTLTWTDGLSEPRSISLTDAPAGVYGTGTYLGYSELTSQIAVEKPHPRIPPTAARATDGAYNSNNVAADSFQFAVQLVFRDNTVSAFSPLSKIVAADTYPLINNTTGNYISVSYSIESDAAEIVKKIRYAYVKNGTGEYFIFKEQSAGGTISFYNNESISSVDTQELGQINSVPQKSRASVIHNQRLIETMDSFDYEDIGTVSLSLTNSSWDDANIREVHLPGTSYTYGIVCFDRFGRTNGVIAEAKISIPVVMASGNSDIPFTSNVWVNWLVSGSFPSWAVSWALVRKNNETIASSCVVPGLIMFYKKEGDTAGAGEVLDDGKIFYDSRQSGQTGNLFIKMALNIPVSVDSTYRIRPLDNFGQTNPTEPILDIEGDKLICGNFGVSDYTAITSFMLFRLEKYRTDTDEFFFETGIQYLINSGSTTTSGRVYGDHWHKEFVNYVYEPIEQGTFNYSFGSGSLAYIYSYPSAIVTSESPTTSAITVDISVATTERSIDEEKKGSGFRRSARSLLYFITHPFQGTSRALEEGIPERQIVTNNSKSVFSWDYSKSCSSNGRGWTTVRNRQTSRRPTSLAISDKYVSNTSINGLNKFTSIYTLPPNRTPIRRLVDIGNSNILLAIHERTTTALATYSGDNILHTSDGSEIVGDGKSIVGYDRELSGGYGTIYPDSVSQYGERAWWFDAYKGEACRYAANGIVPIGSIYKMKTFFKQKGDQFVNTTNRNVITGYDPLSKMVFFTFRSSVPEEEATWAFIDKDGEERWIGPYNILPDRYVCINNRLFAFLNGQMHEIGPGTPLNFFGNSYPASIDQVFNTEFDKDKILRSIALSGSDSWGADIVVPKTTGPDLRTYLVPADWKLKDDNYCVDIRRHIDTPGFASQALARIGGSTIIGKQYNIHFERDEDFILYTLGYIYQLSGGHRTF